MDLAKEFIEEHGLNEDQVKAIDGYVEGEYIPTLKKGWDGKANTQAESILEGAANFAQEKLGVKLARENGEKWGDWYARFSETALSEKSTALDDKQKEYDDKLANFKGGEAYKAELETLKGEKDTLQQQVAELSKLEGFDAKYEESQKELSGLKLNVAFNAAKPNFPDTVNEYEATAKWNAFKESVLEKHTIEIANDSTPLAVSKENPHIKTPLKDLVGNDETLKGLLEGREQKGTGAKGADFTTVEGVPFKVKKDATTEEISAQIREHLTEKLKSSMHPDFASEFAELMNKIKNPKQTA